MGSKYIWVQAVGHVRAAVAGVTFTSEAVKAK